jgi:lysophospholipase L1-like esterase
LKWRKFVAIGDSFTEGLDDPRPDGVGFRGWADLVAQKLAVESKASEQHRGEQAGAVFRYANLAIRGRRFDQVVDEQVQAALDMAPDLISFNAGGNDIVLRKFDLEDMLSRFEQVLISMRASLADVIIFTLPDVTSRLPRRELILPRLQRLNAETTRLAELHGAILVDMWRDDEFRNPHLWSMDRLHLAPAGHRRVAAHALNALGVTPDPSWLTPPLPFEAQSWLAARTADVRWVRRYYMPWLKRRLTNQTTGDLITAKRPTLTPVVETEEESPTLTASAD